MVDETTETTGHKDSPCGEVKEPLVTKEEKRTWVGEFVIGVGQAITNIGKSIRDKGTPSDLPDSK